MRGSVGELIGRAPLFARRDHMEMLRAINAQLGSPGEGALRSIEDGRAVRDPSVAPSS